MSFSLSLHFLPVLSQQTSVCSTLSFILFFWGHNECKIVSSINEVNKFIEDNHRYFYPPEYPDDYRFDVGNERELVEDVDAQTLIKLVNFLKKR